MKLRTDQRNAVNHVMHSAKRSVLVVAPTATGKTPILAELARQWVAQGKRVLVLAHREELVTQAADHLRATGLAVGIISAKHPHHADPKAPVQVASVPTMARRGNRPDADAILVDEAHRAPAKSYVRIIEGYPLARVVGLTATPVRLGSVSKLQIADVFEELYQTIEPQVAVDLGIIAPLEGRVWVPPTSLGEVKKAKGDFNTHELGEIMSKRVVVGSIVKAWKKHAKQRSTILFAATRKQSRKMVRAFRRSGISAEHLDSATSSEVRRATLARFSAGQFRVLCNVGLFTEGVNLPRAKCIILARPTYSLGLFLQMVGRGRRLWNGESCLVHDHSGLIGEHLGPDDSRDWKLGGKSRGPGAVACPKCGAVRPVGTRRVCDCDFDDNRGALDPSVVLRGYEYGLDEFLAIRDAKFIEAKRLYLSERLSVRAACEATGASKTRLQSTGAREGWLRSLSESHLPDPALIEQGRKLYVDEGKSYSQVGAALGISAGQVGCWAKRGGWARDHATACAIHNSTPENVKMRRQFERGDTSAEIAKRFGVDRGLVYYNAKRFGWVRNSKAHALAVKRAYPRGPKWHAVREST